MKTANFYLKKKMKEVFIVEPNDLNIDFLTNFYKKATSYLKTTPFIIIIPFSFLAGLFIYLIFGYLIVRLTTLLQYGF